MSIAEFTSTSTSDEDFERLRHQAGDWLEEYFDHAEFPSMTVIGWNSLCKAIALFADKEAQRRDLAKELSHDHD